jgi:hypothetical protein
MMRVVRITNPGRTGADYVGASGFVTDPSAAIQFRCDLDARSHTTTKLHGLHLHDEIHVIDVL